MNNIKYVVITFTNTEGDKIYISINDNLLIKEGKSRNLHYLRK